MTKESIRKCSHCGHNGHNLRTCNGKGCFKLFGVKIDLNKEDESIRKSNGEEESIRKCKSMGNLQQACNADHREVDAAAAGYLSDGLIQSEQAKRAHERKKGVPWTEDEHRLFLVGLKNLGKGDWRGISKNYVPSRTPTQVASHAQKYFIRKTTTERKKRRSSVFDLPFKEQSPPPHQATPALPSNKASEINQQVSNSQVAPLKNTTEINGQASTSTHVVTSEKPPLSPGARPYGIQIPDFHHMPYMMGMPSNMQSVPPTEALHSVTFVPVMNYKPMMNYTNASYIYIPNNSNGNLATYSPFMSRPLSGPLPQQHHHHQGPAPAGPSTSVTKKGSGLEVSIGALSI